MAKQRKPTSYELLGELSGDGSEGVHCFWCGRDSAGLLEGSGDELPSRA